MHVALSHQLLLQRPHFFIFVYVSIVKLRVQFYNHSFCHRLIPRVVKEDSIPSGCLCFCLTRSACSLWSIYPVPNSHIQNVALFEGFGKRLVGISSKTLLVMCQGRFWKIWKYLCGAGESLGAKNKKQHAPPPHQKLLQIRIWMSHNKCCATFKIKALFIAT